MCCFIASSPEIASTELFRLYHYLLKDVEDLVVDLLLEYYPSIYRHYPNYKVLD